LNKSITHLPDTSIYLKKVIKSVFKLEDPNDTYRKLKKINKGSSGLIYKCKRIDNDEEVAMKMVVPKNRAEYDAIQNEVGIMMLCTSESNIIQCKDAYDFDGKLWIYMDLMDIGAMTDLLIESSDDIKENCIKYLLREVLIGLDYLHSNSILHRDIKSDNILINT